MQILGNRICNSLLVLSMLFSWPVIAAEQTVRLIAHIDENGMPIVTLPLASGDQSFIVDTGSDAGLHVPKEFIDRLGDKAKETGTIRTTDLAGRVNILRKYRIDTFKIGNIGFNGLEAVERKPWGAIANEEARLVPSEDNINEMVLGRGFFAGKAALFDYPSGFIELMSPADAESYAAAHGLKALATVDSPSGIVVTTEGLDGPIRLVLDTGAADSVIRDGRRRAGSPTSCAPPLGKHEGPEAKYCSAVLIPVSGKGHLPPIRASVVNSDFDGLEADGLLGANFLLQGKLLIDFAKSRVYMEPVANKK